MPGDPRLVVRELARQFGVAACVARGNSNVHQAGVMDRRYKAAMEQGAITGRAHP